MTNHTRYLTFDADDNLIDYLIELVFETLQRWPEDYYLSDFNENWADSHISNIWDEYWTCLTQEQQSEMMDYVVSCVAESFD